MIGSVHTVLVLTAFALTVLHGSVGRPPLFVAVLLITIALLVR